MRRFAPDERVLLPNGQEAFVHVRIIPWTDDLDEKKLTDSLGREHWYEVTPDGRLWANECQPMGSICPECDCHFPTAGQIPKPESTAWTVDDLRPLGDENDADSNNDTTPE